jgi:hypothetical protein
VVQVQGDDVDASLRSEAWELSALTCGRITDAEPAVRETQQEEPIAGCEQLAGSIVVKPDEGAAVLEDWRAEERDEGERGLAPVVGEEEIRG